VQKLSVACGAFWLQIYFPNSRYHTGVRNQVFFDLWSYFSPHCSITVSRSKTRNTAICRSFQGLLIFYWPLRQYKVASSKPDQFSRFLTFSWIELFTYPGSVLRIWKAIAISLERFVILSISFTSGPKLGSKSAQTQFSTKNSNSLNNLEFLCCSEYDFSANAYSQRQLP